jgi:hypothetical protein
VHAAPPDNQNPFSVVLLEAQRHPFPFVVVCVVVGTGTVCRRRYLIFLFSLLPLKFMLVMKNFRIVL